MAPWTRSAPALPASTDQTSSAYIGCECHHDMLPSDVHLVHLAALFVIVKACQEQCMACLCWPCMVSLEGQDSLGWTFSSKDDWVYLRF